MAHRMDHTRCSHTATTSARSACRRHWLSALRTAQDAYGPTQSTYAGSVEWDAYDNAILTFALIANIDVSAAYRFVEETEI